MGHSYLSPLSKRSDTALDLEDLAGGPGVDESPPRPAATTPKCCASTCWSKRMAAQGHSLQRRLSKPPYPTSTTFGPGASEGASEPLLLFRNSKACVQDSSLDGRDLLNSLAMLQSSLRSTSWHTGPRPAIAGTPTISVWRRLVPRPYPPWKWPWRASAKHLLSHDIALRSFCWVPKPLWSWLSGPQSTRPWISHEMPPARQRCASPNPSASEGVAALAVGT